MTAPLEYASGRDAVVVGKSAPAFFATVLTELGIGPAAAVMVGDDVESDVGGAERAGLAGVLVRTGKYRADAVAASGVRPTATVDSIADVPALLASAQASEPRSRTVTRAVASRGVDLGPGVGREPRDAGGSNDSTWSAHP